MSAEHHTHAESNICTHALTLHARSLARAQATHFAYTPVSFVLVYFKIGVEYH